jgi:hypothetical protein
MAPGLARVSSWRKDALLEAEVLEHGLDHHVGVLHVRHLERARDQRQPPVPVGRAELAARDAAIVVVLHALQAALQPLVGCVDQRDGNADVGQRHGDAAAHGAGTDDGHLPDRAQRRVGRNVGNPGRFGGGGLGVGGSAFALGIADGEQVGGAHGVKPGCLAASGLAVDEFAQALLGLRRACAGRVELLDEQAVVVRQVLDARQHVDDHPVGLDAVLRDADGQSLALARASPAGVT